MRPFKVRVLSNNVKKVTTEKLSDSQPTIGVSTQTYIDYTNFQDGFVMVYDEDRNRYHFVNPDDVLDNTYQQEQKPQNFTDILIDYSNDNLNVDFGEY